MHIAGHFSILPSKHFKMSTHWIDWLTFCVVLPLFFSLLILPSSQHAISYITFSKWDHAKSLEWPRSHVDAYRPDSVMFWMRMQCYGCNAVGGPDVPLPWSNRNTDGLFISINIPYRLLLEALPSITAGCCIVVLWSSAANVMRCSRPLRLYRAVLAS